MEDENYEEQRYGRNKNTHINNSYIKSGEYRRKFDEISDNPKLNRKLYCLAKKMLRHRAGTMYEDMYWLNPDTAAVIAAEIDGEQEEKIEYSETTIRSVENVKGLMTIHSHPNSYPPSADDFNSNYEHGYVMGIVCCHDGKIFVYRANEYVDLELYTAYVQKYKMEGNNEFEAQMSALRIIMKNTDIAFREL
jgi:hypothetical protein